MTAIMGALAAGYQPATPTAVVAITDQTIDVENSVAIATYSLNTDRTVQNTTSILETWLTGSSSVGNYEVMATKTSGTTVSGTLNTWQSLSSARSWSVVNGTQNNSTKSVGLTISIRLASSGVVQDTASVNLLARSPSS